MGLIKAAMGAAGGVMADQFELDERDCTHQAKRSGCGNLVWRLVDGNSACRNLCDVKKCCKYQHLFRAGLRGTFRGRWLASSLADDQGCKDI